MMFNGFESLTPARNVNHIRRRAEAVKNRPKKPIAALVNMVIDAGPDGRTLSKR